MAFDQLSALWGGTQGQPTGSPLALPGATSSDAQTGATTPALGQNPFAQLLAGLGLARAANDASTPVVRTPALAPLSALWGGGRTQPQPSGQTLDGLLNTGGQTNPTAPSGAVMSPAADSNQPYGKPLAILNGARQANQSTPTQPQGLSLGDALIAGAGATPNVVGQSKGSAFISGLAAGINGANQRALQQQLLDQKAQSDQLAQRKTLTEIQNTANQVQPFMKDASGNVIPTPGGPADPAYLQKKAEAEAHDKWQVIGEDQYGRKQYGYAPDKDAMPAGGAPNAAPPQIDPNVHGQTALGQVDPAIQGRVQAIIQGRAPLPVGFEASTPTGRQVIQAVTQVDPTFETGNANARVKTWNDFTSGKTANAITAGNTALLHLGELNDLGAKLGNFDTGIPGNSLLNEAYNGITGSQQNYRAGLLKAYMDQAHKFAGEVEKFYTGTGGTQTEREQDVQNLSPDMSPTQMQQVLQQNAKALTSKVEALQDRWRTGMGPLGGDFPLIGPQQRKVLEKLGVQPTSGEQASPLLQPGGQGALGVPPAQPPGPAGGGGGTPPTGAPPTPAPKRFIYDASGNLVPAGGQPIKVATPEEARKLPSGTPIILPDGSLGRVP